MSTKQPAAHIIWGDETHTNGFYAHTAITPDFKLTIAWPDADHCTPANENMHWTLTDLDGTIVAKGDEMQFFMAQDAVLKAFARQRPATYAVRTWITSTLNDPEGPMPAGGPTLDDVTLVEARRAAVEFTEAHRIGVTCWLYDMQGEPFVTCEQGVFASL